MPDSIYLTMQLKPALRIVDTEIRKDCGLTPKGHMMAILDKDNQRALRPRCSAVETGGSKWREEEKKHRENK